MLPWQFAHWLCQKHKTDWIGRKGNGYVADLIESNMESQRAAKYAPSL